ncbi:MAG: hypothetical protein AABW51_01485 [Nanoarchaeota archaeon]
MDERYKFVRGQPFDGLEDYASAPIIKMKNKSLTYPIIQREKQTSFHGFYDQRQLNENLGFFFELIAQGIYGGQLINKDFVSPQLGLFSGREEIIQPGLIVKEGYYKEVKSCRNGSALKLLVFQMNKYRSFLRLKTTPYSAPDFEFEIFRHGIKDLDENFKTKSLEDLVKAICPKIKSSVSLPARVIYTLYFHGNNGGNPYTSKYSGEKWEPAVNFKSTGQNILLAYPLEFLEQLGLDTNDFEITRYRFPTDVTMNGTRIPSIPMLRIEDKKHHAWLPEFNENTRLEEMSLSYSGNLDPEGGSSLEIRHGDISFDPEELDNQPISKHDDDDLPF